MRQGLALGQADDGDAVGAWQATLASASQSGAFRCWAADAFLPVHNPHSLERVIDVNPFRGSRVPHSVTAFVPEIHY